MTNQLVINTHVDGVLTLSLNNPERRNAMDEAMLDSLIAHVEEARNDRTVRLLVLRGEGANFCAGADLKTDEGIEVTGLRTLDKANTLIETILSLELPTLAVLHGSVVGVGASFALACDLTMAAESTTFLLAFTRLGLMPDGGASAIVPASVGRSRAMRMALLAESMPAAEAYSRGLISHMVPDAILDEAAEELINRLATGPTRAFVETKLGINEATLSHASEILALEKAGQTRLLRTKDLAEGVDAFVEKRPAAFVGE